MKQGLHFPGLRHAHVCGRCLITVLFNCHSAKESYNCIIGLCILIGTFINNYRRVWHEIKLNLVYRQTLSPSNLSHQQHNESPISQYKHYTLHEKWYMKHIRGLYPSKNMQRKMVMKASLLCYRPFMACRSVNNMQIFNIFWPDT